MAAAHDSLRDWLEATRLAWLLIVALTAPMPGRAATIEQTTLAHLENLLAVKARSDDEVIAHYNQQLDEAWTYFLKKEAAYPVLRQELDA